MSSALQFRSDGIPIRMYAQEPRWSPGTKPQPAILLLHGSGGHVDFWSSQLGPLLTAAGLGLYAPHYFDRTGTVRADLATISDGVHVPQWLGAVADALHFVAERPGVDPERIVLAGISLGAFLALAHAAQLSAKDASSKPRVRALLDISGGLVPPYDTLATARLPPTLILHGAADPIVPVTFAHDLDRRLTELGVPHRTEVLEGQGHWFSGAVLPRILNVVSMFLEQNLK